MSRSVSSSSENIAKSPDRVGKLNLFPAVVGNADMDRTTMNRFVVVVRSDEGVEKRLVRSPNHKDEGLSPFGVEE